ncbi:MAG: serine kinase [Rhodobacteraceae bacterium]|nr:serine kinase [Paracoccaceae bacterium]MAY47177.1 serine kinase [Paracoccaceae bacterium]QEW22198.1 HPr kinase/phosphorylase [Marinibacterium anthonyi]
MAVPPPEEILHASCVALNGRGLLIRGASGAGKSTLALWLMAHGARLVGDDRVRLSPGPQAPIARPVPAIAGLIEARGIGILRADNVSDAPVVAMVDLDATESERVPPLRHTRLVGCDVVLLRRVEGPHFEVGLLQFLRSGRQDPQ